ncbi:hypothetical protein L596_012566 [Steinernema carpocapsae]|uniref:7TM GPCR serpentine receptor class x (Srx) domain-containing protein n=1 Tax=Steinernema carpocapsae TaxID=34508 RepID=A0A4U5NYE2_STECR|nr:hypothetical protein L596_012566 [Steinernema carpocapsae]
MFLYTHPKTASAFLSLSGFLGLLVNLFILHRIIYGKIFGKSFGRIWISRAIAYVGASALFAFFLPAVAFYDAHLLKTGWIRAAIQFINFFVITLICSNFLIAWNRCVLVICPIHYKYVFCDLKTKVLIASTWIVSLMLMIPNVIDNLTQSHIKHCHKTPLDSDTSPYMQPDECRTWLEFINIVLPSIVIGLTIVVDTYSMWRLGHFVKIMVQAIVAIFIYISMCFSAFIKNEFIQFLASSFLWGMMQAIDGVVVIFFNTEMHAGLRRRFSTDDKNIVNSTGSSPGEQKNQFFSFAQKCVH